MPAGLSLLCLLPISQQETGTVDVHHWTSFTWVPGPELRSPLLSDKCFTQ